MVALWVISFSDSGATDAQPLNVVMHEAQRADCGKAPRPHWSAKFTGRNPPING